MFNDNWDFFVVVFEMVGKSIIYDDNSFVDMVCCFRVFVRCFECFFKCFYEIVKNVFVVNFDGNVGSFEYFCMYIVVLVIEWFLFDEIGKEWFELVFL